MQLHSPAVVRKESIPIALSPFVALLEASRVHRPHPASHAVDANLAGPETHDGPQARVGLRDGRILAAAPADGGDPQGGEWCKGVCGGDLAQGGGVVAIEHNQNAGYEKLDGEWEVHDSQREGGCIGRR